MLLGVGPPLSEGPTPLLLWADYGVVVRQPNRTGVTSRADLFTVILSDNTLPGGIVAVLAPLLHVSQLLVWMELGMNVQETGLSTPLTRSVNVAGSLPDALTLTARSWATIVALGDR